IAALLLNGGAIVNTGSGQNADVGLFAPGTVGSLGFNKNLIIDGTPPRVTNVTSPTANGTYSVGDTIVVTVQFNKPVAVMGGPVIALNSGGTATYTGGTGSDTLTFSYKVASGQISADLDYLSTNALSLNGGTITEVSSGQNAALTLPTPAGVGSLGANKDSVIAPRAAPTNVGSPTADGTYGVGTSIAITVQFNRAVSVTGTPLLALNSGGTATYSPSGNGTNTLTFAYTVAAGENAADLDYLSTSALTLNGGTIRDNANGLDADLTLPAPGAAGSLGANKNLVIDTKVRTTNVTSPAANNTYAVGAVVPITITFSAPVLVTGSPELALNSGGTAVYSGGSTTATLTFNYMVAAGENSADL